MKEETYKKIYIRSEADLPKENGRYIVHHKSTDIIKDFPMYNTSISKRLWNEHIDWYLQPQEQETYGEVFEKKPTERNLGKVPIKQEKQTAEKINHNKYGDWCTKCNAFISIEHTTYDEIYGRTHSGCCGGSIVRKQAEAEDALKILENKGTSHQEFIKEDKDDITKAKELVVRLIKEPIEGEKAISAESTCSYCEKCIFRVNYDKFHKARMAFEHPSPAVEKCYPENKQSVTDEEIEAFSKSEIPFADSDWNYKVGQRVGIIIGAKAMRDRLIPKK